VSFFFLSVLFDLDEVCDKKKLGFSGPSLSLVAAKKYKKKENTVDVEI
jgi:hypothetical protein